MHESAIRGNVSELRVAAALWKAGFIVSSPMGDSVKYDLVMDSGAGLYRVQVKSGRKKDGYVKFGCSSHHNDRVSRGGVRQTIYTKQDFDYFGVYCDQLDRVWLIPVSELELSRTHQKISYEPQNIRAGELAGHYYTIPDVQNFRERS